MVRKIVTVSLLAVALGCASGGSSSGGSSSGGGFGPEGSDPGMEPRGGGRGMEGGTVNLRTVYFEFDRDTLRDKARQDLRHNAEVIANDPDLRIEIQGNCDERGSAEYNLALGMRRAETAKRYLVDLGVSGSRLSAMSFGEENPAVRGSNESAWAKNRRDDFKKR